MKSAPFQEALRAVVKDPDEELLVTPLTGGLIHKTYKVVIPSTNDSLLLQQLNHSVFAEPEKVQANYRAISEQLARGKWSPGHPPVTVPKALRFLDGHFLFVDSHGKYWRIFEFIENGISLPKPASVAQAGKAAETFASLTASFAFFPIAEIGVTLPGFHDLSLRYAQFRRALSLPHADRPDPAAYVIAAVEERNRYVNFYETILHSPGFEKRLMHHDAKISNILFHKDTGQVMCPVDLDTCMPGYFFSDLGDMIRSMAGSEDENGTKDEDLHIQEDFYRAIVGGYLDVLQDQLTDKEKKYIHCAGLLMIYMQALRFTTDHLQGDTYYQTEYPGQNLERALNQLSLLEKLEAFLEKEYAFSI